MTHADSLTVSSAWMEFLMDFAKLSGCDLAKDFNQIFQDDLDALKNEALRYDLLDEAKLFAKALAVTKNPFFGLEMGSKVRPNYAGILGYASMSSARLRDAVDLLVKYEHYYTEAAICRLESNPAEDTFSIVWEPCLNNLPQQRHRVEASFSSWLNFGRWITGTENNPSKIEFTHNPPKGEDLSPYEKVFRCPIEFGAARNAITLNTDFLDLPVLDSNPEVNKVTLERIKALVAAFEARGDLLKEVRVAIHEALAEGPTNLDLIADRLAIKPWTLRRKLRALGHDFSTLMDDVRKALATEMLANPRCQISEIAGSLGYSEQSAFNRAFKRWFQCTPLEYRAKLLSHDQDSRP